MDRLCLSKSLLFVKYRNKEQKKNKKAKAADYVPESLLIIKNKIINY